MQKKPIIIISVLCVISLALGYLSGMKDEEILLNNDAQKNSKKESEFLKEGLVAYYPFNGNAKDGRAGMGIDGKVMWGNKFMKKGNCSCLRVQLRRNNVDNCKA